MKENDDIISSLRPSVTEIAADKIVEEMLRRIDPAESVLEVGPGVRPLQLKHPTGIRVYVEPSSKYANLLEIQLKSTPGKVIIESDALTFLKSLQNASFDLVLCIDVIEHLSKEDGFVLLKEMLRVARKQVVVFTPQGFMPQHVESGSLDPWGLDEPTLQNHLSGWSVEDFPLEFECIVAENFHFMKNGDAFGAILAIANIERDPSSQNCELDYFLMTAPCISTLQRDSLLFNIVVPCLTANRNVLILGTHGSGNFEPRLKYGITSELGDARWHTRRHINIGKSKIINSLKIGAFIFPTQFQSPEKFRVVGFSRLERLIIGGVKFTELNDNQLPLSIPKELPQYLSPRYILKLFLRNLFFGKRK